MIEINLKEELDKIDNGMMNAIVEGFYNSRLKILIGMWEKGKIIGEFTGVDSPQWRELESSTGRDHKSLKQWYEIFKNNQDRKRYIGKVAKPKALAWAQKALQIKNPTSEIEIDILENALNGLEKWVEKYSTESQLSDFIPIIEDLIEKIKNINE